MVRPRIQFACGEFVPGKGIIKNEPPDIPIEPKYIIRPDIRRVDTPFLPPPKTHPPVILPPGVIPPNFDPPIRPPGNIPKPKPDEPPGVIFPPITGIQKQVWYCADVREDLCPDGEHVEKLWRSCRPIYSKDKGNYPGPFYDEKEDCEEYCDDLEWPCPGAGISGIVDFDPPGVIDIPRTGASRVIWYCAEIKDEYCNDGVTIKKTIKNCKSISEEDQQQFPGRTFYDSKSRCERNCPDEEWPCPNIDPPDNPFTGVDAILEPEPNRGYFPYPSSIPGYFLKQLKKSIISDQGFQQTNLNTPSQTQESAPLESVTAPINNSPEKVVVYNVSDKVESNVDSDDNYIYDGVYNFFGYNEDSLSEIKFRSNEKYLSIFNTFVGEKVFYMLSLHQTDSPWKEYAFLSVSLQEVVLSLREDLRNALQSIHYAGNRLVNPNIFFEKIRNLLREGRLDEFDSQYYIDLARNQKEDVFIFFDKSTNTDNLKASMGYIKETSKPVDSSYYPEDIVPVMNKVRTLLDDINAKVKVNYCSDNSFRVNESGASLNCGVSESTIPIYPGDQYYFAVSCDTGNPFAIPLDTDLSSTLFLPMGDRENALYLLDEGSNFDLIATSPSAVSEFTDQFAAGLENPPELYFQLDISSVTPIINSKNSIDRYAGTYSLLTSEEDIINHSRIYGLMASRVCLDYRDPFYVYASSTGEMEFRNKDLVFFEDSVNILAKSLPFAIILTPGYGSEHNPFHGFSTLDNVRGDIQRTLSLISDINVWDNKPNTTAIPQSLVYDKLGEYVVTLVDEPNTQNVVYQYDSTVSSYYSGTTEDWIERDIVVNLLQERLEAKYDISVLTWWDVIRRLNSEDFMKFLIEAPKLLRDELRSGLRGYNINHVSNNETQVITGLDTEVNSSIEDPIIISEDHRTRLLDFNA
jgi:hypothetical protein